MNVLEFMQSLSPLFSVVAALFAYLAARRVREIHVMINSRLSELMKAEKELSFLKGGDAEKEAHKAGEADKAVSGNVRLLLPDEPVSQG